MLANKLLGAAKVAGAANYVEDVFSTWLYTGTGASQTITNGIDLAGKGGMIWFKCRSNATNNALFNTAIGTGSGLSSNLTNGSVGWTDSLSSFDSNGFTLGVDSSGVTNFSARTFVSWTFRKQAKFFDVVTYTGNGTARTIAHNLGSTPGCVIVKRTDSTGDWAVYHRGLTSAAYNIYLNLGNAQATATSIWNSTAPTSTVFSVGTATAVNANGGTYVAYIFAHNDGGFGASGTDNVITCGTYLGSNHRAKEIVTLGYEPQWVMVKNISSAANSWVMTDIMRNMSSSATDPQRWLLANSSAVESTATTDQVVAASTGFYFNSVQSDINEAGSTFIYIAIRRPMKPPTSGTSVYYAELVSQADTIQTTSVPFPGDLYLSYSRNGTDGTNYRNTTSDRLRGLGGPSDSFSSGTLTNDLMSNSTNAEATRYIQLRADSRNLTRGSGWNSATYGNFLFHVFRRAPGFFDVVCYTGTGSTTSVKHNLGVVPELIITKRRDSAYDWVVYSQTLGTTKVLFLNTVDAQVTFTGFGNVTSTNFDAISVVQNGNQVAYLFATLAGVSKVGSYTGNGSNQTINCGFTGGARFVMIKRTDSTGDWYVWDTARGIVSGNDPRLSLNTTAAEVTTDDSVDTDSTGFVVNQLSATNINVTSATYIFLSIS